MKFRHWFILALVILALAIVPLTGCNNNNTVTATVQPTATVVNTITATATQTTTATTTATTTVAAPTPAQPTAVTLNISAAASLTDALKAVNAQYTLDHPNVTLTPNFASSGTLQKQIEQGAPTDLFLSAGAKQMDALEKGGLIVTASRQNLLINKLVLIVPNDSTLNLTDFKDLVTDKVVKIAIGDPKSVPAGDYAQQAFDLLGITAKVTSKYVMGSDVKAVLSYVESGNVDAGLVYSTDAMISTKVKVVAFAPDEINAKIVYPAAVITASKVPEEAAKYEQYLSGPEAKAIFEKYGFTVVSKQ